MSWVVCGGPGEIHGEEGACCLKRWSVMAAVAGQEGWGARVVLPCLV